MLTSVTIAMSSAIRWQSHLHMKIVIRLGELAKYDHVSPKMTDFLLL